MVRRASFEKGYWKRKPQAQENPFSAWDWKRKLKRWIQVPGACL